MFSDLRTKTKLVLFDFDGTLTTKDTFVAFIRYAKGNVRTLCGFMLHAPILALMLLHRYPNHKAKQRIFSYFFKGMRLADFDKLCQRFANDSRERLLRPKAKDAMRRALDNGAKVMVVSASVDNWVKPFFSGPEERAGEQDASDITILGTRIEVRDGIVTGEFSTPNCYGMEKVRRVKAALTKPREEYDITAFGDSRGDKEMLNYADQKHYKPFRN